MTSSNLTRSFRYPVPRRCDTCAGLSDEVLRQHVPQLTNGTDDQDDEARTDDELRQAVYRMQLMKDLPFREYR